MNDIMSENFYSNSTKAFFSTLTISWNYVQVVCFCFPKTFQGHWKDQPLSH